jgi:hypothetical protein
MSQFWDRSAVVSEESAAPNYSPSEKALKNKTALVVEHIMIKTWARQYPRQLARIGYWAYING